ncbi:MAG: hypothetical protein U0996_11230 [Planctomycetaceae bacterium]
MDLFGGHVRVLIDGRDIVINSPWPADSATLARELPQLAERFTLEKYGDDCCNGINEADEFVLRDNPRNLGDLAPEASTRNVDCVIRG